MKNLQKLRQSGLLKSKSYGLGREMLWSLTGKKIVRDLGLIPPRSEIHSFLYEHEKDLGDVFVSLALTGTLYDWRGEGDQKIGLRYDRLFQVDERVFYVERERGTQGREKLITKLNRYSTHYRKTQEAFYVLIRAWGYTVKEVPQGYFPDFDMQCNRVQDGRYTAFTVEVKHDYWYDKTGNLGLEHDSLDHSKADFFAICAGDPIKAVFLMPLPQIRTYAHQAKEYIRTIGQRKDGKPNWAAVVPESVLLKLPNVHKLVAPKYAQPQKKEEEKVLFSRDIPRGLTYKNH